MNNLTLQERLEYIKKKLAIVMLEKQRISKSARYFIDNYVFIEQSTGNKGLGVSIPFNLWSEQVRLLNVLLKNKLIVVCKARQLGITWLTLAYALWRCITREGYKVAVVSKGEEDCKELIRRIEFMAKHLPKWMMRYKMNIPNGYDGLIYEWTAMEFRIFRTNGEMSVIKTFPSTPISARSYTADLVIFEEWAFHPFANEIWTSFYPIINRPDSQMGQFIGLSTGDVGTLFEQIWLGAINGENDFTPVFLKWDTDPRRTTEWRQKTLKNLGITGIREYPEKWQDAFHAGSGAFFHMWDEKIHVPYSESWYPPEDAVIVRAYDYGYTTNGCCKWYAITKEEIVCYREYYPKMVNDREQAITIKRMSVRPDGIPEDIALTIADHTCWIKRGESGRSTAQIFANEGVYMKPAGKDRVSGWKRLIEYLTPYTDGKGELTAKLVFTRACKNTIRTYPLLKYDKNKPEDLDTRQEDHAQDCDRILVMHAPLDNYEILSKKRKYENMLIYNRQMEELENEEYKIWSREL